MKKEHSSSRREFVKKAAYVTPAILTLRAAPAYAKPGSEKPIPPKRRISRPPVVIKPPSRRG